MRLPQFVHIEVSNRCNVRCRSCPWGPGPHGPLLHWAMFERMLPLVGPDCTVNMHGLGEPLMHPAFTEMANACVAQGGRCTTSTNGTLITPTLLAALPSPGFFCFSISIHGAREETHERLQRGVKSTRVWQAVRDCREVGIGVVIACVVMMANRAELSELVERAREAGANAVVWHRMLYHQGSGLEGEDPFTDGEEAATREILARATTLGERYGMVMHDRIG